MTRVINLPGSDSSDFYFDIVSNNSPSYSVANKFGTNPALSTSDEDLWGAGGIKTYLTTAATMEVISSDANDTAAGTGAREVTIYGLDSLFNEIQETLATAGTSASAATSQSFMRIQRVVVTQVGAYGGINAGILTIRVSSAGSTQSHIAAGKGESHSLYSAKRA